MLLVERTAKPIRKGRCVVGFETVRGLDRVVGEVPDDPDQLKEIAQCVIGKMVRDGVVPEPYKKRQEATGEAASQGVRVG